MAIASMTGGTIHQSIVTSLGLSLRLLLTGRCVAVKTAHDGTASCETATPRRWRSEPYAQSRDLRAETSDWSEHDL